MASSDFCWVCCEVLRSSKTALATVAVWGKGPGFSIGFQNGCLYGTSKDFLNGLM